MEDKTMLLLFGALVVIMLCILFFRKRKVVKKHEEKDYDAALAIVRDFAREKIQALGERDSAAKEAALEALAFLATPSPLSKSQQIFGITVFPKEKQR